jgi:hypothetical protein
LSPAVSQREIGAAPIALQAFVKAISAKILKAMVDPIID